MAIPSLLNPSQPSYASARSSESEVEGDKFLYEDVKHLDTAPLVNAAVMLLAKCVTLPLEDAMSFKDGLERRIDLDLKIIYTMAGMACKPALALAATSKAMEVWMENVDTALRNVSEVVAKS